MQTKFLIFSFLVLFLLHPIQKGVPPADMYVSTLRNYIRTMGGKLKITVVFPNGVVEISEWRFPSFKTLKSGRTVEGGGHALNRPSSPSPAARKKRTTVRESPLTSHGSTFSLPPCFVTSLLAPSLTTVNLQPPTAFPAPGGQTGDCRP